MVRGIFRCLLVVFAASLLPHPAWAASGGKVITIAADEWCPINCVPDNTPEGIGIDLARAVFEPLGYKVRYVIMPWSRALDEVRKGTVDAVVGANTADDPTLLFPREPLAEISDDFYVLKNNPIQYTHLKSLKGSRLGVIEDYGYGKDVVAFLNTQRGAPGAVQAVTGEDALQQNIRKLQAGRIDVIIESKAVMNYTLRKMKLERDIKWIGGVRQGYVYLGFSPVLPGSREMIRQFDEGVVALRKAKKLPAMYEPYSLLLPTGF